MYVAWTEEDFLKTLKTLSAEFCKELKKIKRNEIFEKTFPSRKGENKRVTFQRNETPRDLKYSY